MAKDTHSFSKADPFGGLWSKMKRIFLIWCSMGGSDFLRLWKMVRKEQSFTLQHRHAFKTIPIGSFSVANCQSPFFSILPKPSRAADKRSSSTPTPETWSKSKQKNSRERRRKLHRVNYERNPILEQKAAQAAVLLHLPVTHYNLHSIKCLQRSMSLRILQLATFCPWQNTTNSVKLHFFINFALRQIHSLLFQLD